MAFIPIPQCVLLVAQFQDDEGVLAINRHYAATISVPTETDLEEVAAAYTDWVTEALVGQMQDRWTLTGVVTRAMNEEFGIEFVATSGVPQNGTIGSGQLPNQVSYTITWNTGIVGRSFRGRTYGVGLYSGAVATGQKRLTDAARGSLNDAWNLLPASFADAGHALQVVSLQEGGIPRTEGVTTPVVSGNVRFPLATQRRRLR